MDGEKPGVNGVQNLVALEQLHKVQLVSIYRKPRPQFCLYLSLSS
jgi:hypothetical protein